MLGSFIKKPKNNQTTKTMNNGERAFGEVVRTERLSKKLGLREFAEMVDLSPTFISKMEVGDFKPPKEENIIKIADVLNLDRDFLLAKANKISSELKAIINKEPKLFASFLRRASQKEDLKKYLEEI